MNRIMRVLSIMLIAAVLCITAVADEMPTVGVQEAYLDENGLLKIVTHSTIKEADDPAACLVELDQQRMNIVDIEDYWKTELGTSWLFLTDTATVSTNDGAEPVKALLRHLIDNMEENDNAAVITTGKTFSDIDLIEDKEQLWEEAQAIRVDSSVKTLYATISDAVTYLDTHADVRPHASLVVISNGETNSEEGMTISELQKIVEDANITIYTVAFSSTSSAALNDYTSLSRSGCGGKSIKMPAKSDGTAIAEQILDNERDFRLMTAELPAAVGKELKVYVSYNDKYLEDSTPLNVKLQEEIGAAIAAKPTLEPTLEPTSEPILALTPAPTFLDILEDNLVIVIIGGVCLVLLVVIIILLASGRKQKAAANQGDNTPIPDVVSIHNDETEVDEPREPTTMIALMQVGGTGHACFKGELKEQLIVGRHPEMADIVITVDDRKISRQHFRLCKAAGMIIIENMSQNGTRVNNVEIRQATEIHQQDIIAIGQTNFKISWTRY